MEIELKYSIGSTKIADAIWEDEEVKLIEEDGSRCREKLSAIYFDTKDNDLLKHDIAFRIREEGTRAIASLKWNGKSVGALHTREELNINLGEGKCPDEPDPSVFSESEIGHELMEIIGSQQLIGFMKVDVSRRKVRVDTSQAIMEIALDTGSVETKNGSCPICELEIELYSGKEEDLIKMGELLATTYGLQPEIKSKFARGLALLELI